MTRPDPPWCPVLSIGQPVRAHCMGSDCALWRPLPADSAPFVDHPGHCGLIATPSHLAARPDPAQEPADEAEE